MRKRNIMFIADTIFWYLIYFLPVIMYGIYLIHGSESGALIDFKTFVETQLSLSVMSPANPIYSVLTALFGSGGIIPMFGFDIGNTYILVIVTYFATMVLIHLAIDFILFIPRLCHKWMDMYTKGVEK